MLFVGVRCPLDVVRERRRATWGGVGYQDGGQCRAGAPLGQAVHMPGVYDLEVDTSLLRPRECADLIAGRLEGRSATGSLARLARRG